MAIFAAISAIVAGAMATVNFLAEPPDWLRTHLNRHAPWMVDTAQGLVCTFKSGTHAIAPGPLASCDPGVIEKLISDPCVNFEFVSEDKPNEADDPAAKTNREASKNRLMATRICRMWTAGAGRPFEGSAEKVLRSLAHAMPECFGSGTSGEGKQAFWLRTSSRHVCVAPVRMGKDHQWQVNADVQTYFCIAAQPGETGPANTARRCTPQEAVQLQLPRKAAQ
ncbi:MAG: hypothetical protein K2Z80_07825 [Xanthobacteraceae bacterium]|nr:hypothetical protein [Xanthobacteraceae bacterium]